MLSFICLFLFVCCCCCRCLRASLFLGGSKVSWKTKTESWLISERIFYPHHLWRADVISWYFHHSKTHGGYRWPVPLSWINGVWNNRRTKETMTAQASTAPPLVLLPFTPLWTVLGQCWVIIREGCVGLTRLRLYWAVGKESYHCLPQRVSVGHDVKDSSY